MRLMRLLVVALAMTALLCGSALAKNYAPPGRAGTSQYAEDIPSAGGNVSTPAMGGGNKTAAQISHIGKGKQGVSKLSKLGKTGIQAAQFVQATAPSGTSSSRSGSSRSGSGSTQPTTSQKPSTAAGRRARTTVLTASGGSALSGVGHLLTGSDSGGIGIFLPLLLALSLAATLVVAVLRLRRPQRDDVAQP
jgi:hypothetical protein